MVKAFGKKESKRMTCHKKYKIRKKVREHNKKLAKTVKATVNKKKKKGDGHVPNLAPFKENLLLEALHQSEAKKEIKATKKTKSSIIVSKKDEPKNPKTLSQSSVPYHTTVAQCCTLLWVIDVRSAKECYCDKLFTEIQGQDKTVIFILNKVDLVPQSVFQYWYSVFSQKALTFVFKSTQILLSDCEQIIPSLKQVLSRFGGVKPLLSNLKKNIEQETTVGVIGMSNVGKSCVVSSILKCCGRTKAKNANFTKLSDNLKLSTIPGLITTEYSGMLNILLNINSYMNQPAEVLTAMSHHISKDDAMFHFTLPDYDHPSGFLDALAIRYNMMQNREPDHAAVGRLILKQLRDQKLKFYVCEGDNCVENVAIPADVVGDVSSFVYSGDALRIRSSEINVVIQKKEKKRKGNDMDVDEEEDEESGEEEFEESEDEDFQSSGEEMS